MIYWWLGSVNGVQRGYEGSADAWDVEDGAAAVIQGCRGNGVFSETQVSVKAEGRRNIH